MDFLTRRSIRKYQDKKIEKTVIDELMKTVLLSPSGRNGRPYEFILVDDKEKIKKLAGSKSSGALFLENAPLVVITVWRDYPTGEDDSSIASTILQLKAHQLGLGSCWIQTKGKTDTDGNSCEDNIRKILGIPQEININNMISLGYPAEERPSYDINDGDMSKIHHNQW